MASFREIAEIVNHGTLQQKEEFSVACSSYNNLRRSIDGIMNQLSRECGWKGPGCLDFRNFHRFHVETGDDGIHFLDGQHDLCRFAIDSTGHAFIEGEWFPYGATTEEAVSLARENCLSQDNVREAYVFSHGGCRQLRGLMYPDGRTVFCREPWFGAGLEDVGLDSLLEGKYPGVRFVSSDVFEDISGRWSYVSGAAVVEDVRPLEFTEYFDGKSISHDGRHPSGDEEMGAYFRGLHESSLFLKEVYRYSLELRRELETRAGLDDGHEETYAFSNAVYPVPGGLYDLDLVTEGGMHKVGSLHFSNGKAVYLTGNFDEEPVVMTGRDEVKAFLSDKCLSGDNVLKARQDLAHENFIDIEVAQPVGVGINVSNRRKV